MKNLLKETEDLMKYYGKTFLDIKSIGHLYHRDVYLTCNWEQFKVLADKEYDYETVALDLEIKFHDGTWFERCVHSFDNTEFWYYVFNEVETYHLPESYAVELRIINNLFVKDSKCARLKDIQR